MAHTYTAFNNYKCGDSLSYPIVIKSPYEDWKSLLIRCKVKTASEVFIGSLVQMDAAGTDIIIEKTTDACVATVGIVVDVVDNKAQLELDNGAKATKDLYFAANSYIWVLPLIPGFIVEVRAPASMTIDTGQLLDANAKGEVEPIAGDVDPRTIVGKAIGCIVSGTGTQRFAMIVK
jgi:hypothetical protein